MSDPGLQQQRGTINARRIIDLFRAKRTVVVRPKRARKAAESYGQSLASPVVTITLGYQVQHGKHLAKLVTTQDFTLVAQHEWIVIAWARGDITTSALAKVSGSDYPMTDNSIGRRVLHHYLAVNGVYSHVQDHRFDTQFDLPLV